MVMVLMERVTTRLFSAATSQNSKLKSILKGKSPGWKGKERSHKNVTKLRLLDSEMYSLTKYVQKLSKYDRKINELLAHGVQRFPSQWIERGPSVKLSSSARRKAYNETLACFIDLSIHGRIDPANVIIAFKF